MDILYGQLCTRAEIIQNLKTVICLDIIGIAPVTKTKNDQVGLVFKRSIENIVVFTDKIWLFPEWSIICFIITPKK